MRRYKLNGNAGVTREPENSSNIMIVRNKTPKTKNKGNNKINEMFSKELSHFGIIE